MGSNEITSANVKISISIKRIYHRKLTVQFYNKLLAIANYFDIDGTNSIANHNLQ